MVRWFALIALGFCLAACTSSRPAELAGLWSSGPASCARGVGLRFEAQAIVAVFEDNREALLARPRYTVARDSGRLTVRVVYDATPEARGRSTRGVLVFQRRDDGWLAPVTHQLEDTLTGTAHVRLNDPLMEALTLRPCGQGGFIGGLRGRV